MKLFLAAHDNGNGTLLSLALVGIAQSHYYARNIVEPVSRIDSTWAEKNVVPYLEVNVQALRESLQMGIHRTTDPIQAKYDFFDWFESHLRRTLFDKITIVTTDFHHVEMLMKLLSKKTDGVSKMSSFKIKFIPDELLPNTERMPDYIPHNAFWDAVHLKNRFLKLKKLQKRNKGP